MEISKKYRHIGYSYPGVPSGWRPIVEQAIVDIEKEMWVQWLPLRVKRWIHYLATGNSCVRIKYNWAYRLRTRLTGGQVVMDIKDKYATLRIYGSFSDKVHKIIEHAEKQCENTCEKCGSIHNVKTIDFGWVYNYCEACRREYKYNNPKFIIR